ncbi:unnamed protein product [Paramecium pentaurelia]|uniref:Transmembrane protein n=1 Tax=Paramecium pentaurelia TaxID=43138 RepID=A0A8S1S218_9CILI|nr:unnamed protein product [Paramecium pentaurelia]
MQAQELQTQNRNIKIKGVTMVYINFSLLSLNYIIPNMRADELNPKKKLGLYIYTIFTYYFHSLLSQHLLTHSKYTLQKKQILNVVLILDLVKTIRNSKIQLLPSLLLKHMVITELQKQQV